MDDTLHRMLGTVHPSSEHHNNVPPFIPSKTWQGVKPGYYFGTSDAKLGTGYYRDDRGLMNGDKSSNNGNGKRKFMDEGKNGDRKKFKVKTGEELLAEAEAKVQKQNVRAIQLTSSGIKSAANHLAKMIEVNQIQRSEHPDNPEKFMESELVLNETIGGFKAVAAADMGLIVKLVSLGVVDSMISLLAHENCDISLAAIDLLVEFFDLDLLTSRESIELYEKRDGRDSLLGFVSSFVDKGGLDLSVMYIGRACFSQEGESDVEEDEENVDGALNILTLIETLLDLEQMNLIGINDSREIKPNSISIACVQNTNLIGWLLDRIDRKDENSLFSPLKLQAAEILSSLMQREHCRVYIPNFKKVAKFTRSEEAQFEKELSTKESDVKTKTIDGIEILLQAIANYRKRDPKTDEECEFLENCFDCLSAILMSERNVAAFLEAQGIELMLRCLRERVHSGKGALKVLYFTLSGTGNEYKKACEVFIDVGGFKIIFPLFMGKTSAIPKPAKCTEAGSTAPKDKESKRMKRRIQAKKEWISLLSSYIMQIMYAMTRHIDEKSPYDALTRFFAKFGEDDFAKSDRLLEFFIKYDKKMRSAELKYYRSEQAEIDETEGLDIELAAFNAKMQGGGDLFFRTSAVVAFIMVGSKKCCEHITAQLKVKGSGISGEY